MIYEHGLEKNEIEMLRELIENYESAFHIIPIRFLEEIFNPKNRIVWLLKNLRQKKSEEEKVKFLMNSLLINYIEYLICKDDSKYIVNDDCNEK